MSLSFSVFSFVFSSYFLGPVTARLLGAIWKVVPCVLTWLIPSKPVYLSPTYPVVELFFIIRQKLSNVQSFINGISQYDQRERS